MKRFEIMLPMCLILALISSVGYSADSPFDKPIGIESGLLEGVANQDHSVVAFKGIPYAAPPVGKLHWREPQSPPKWDRVRKAGACARNQTPYQFMRFIL